MTRVFSYSRISTSDQTNENQIREIAAAGFNIEPHRIVSEVISGSVAAMQRPEFAKLMMKMEWGDVLVVTKLDRIGRNAMDVTATVEALGQRNIKVTCIQLGSMDLTSPAGKMTMGVLAHVAQFERDLLIERTNAGLARSKANGIKSGRKATFNQKIQADIRSRIENGATIAGLAKEFATTRQTIMRVRNRASAN
jgi:putative DNA-invertase from lambdoid prophage Rac